MASRRALRWPNPKSGIESGAVGAQAPTSETPSTEYPNQHRPHPAGATTLLPVTGAPNRKGEQRNGSIQIAAQGRGGAIRGRRTRTAEGHGAHRTEVSGQLQVRDHGAAAATGERGLHERAQGKQHLRPQGHERAGLRATAPLSGGGTAIPDALLGEITFCYELVDDGNNFFRNKEEYERTFQTWTTLANNALSRLRGVMDSDKRRWNGYMRDRKAKTP